MNSKINNHFRRVYLAFWQFDPRPLSKFQMDINILPRHDHDVIRGMDLSTVLMKMDITGQGHKRKGFFANAS